MFHSVIGLDLLEQNLPFDSIPPDLLEQFEFLWHQLFNTSGDLFDTDSFTSAEGCYCQAIFSVDDRLNIKHGLKHPISGDVFST